MKSTALWALIILNAVLLAAFVGRVIGENTAVAQNNRGGAAPAAAARPGDYIMAPADINGSSSGIVVVVDQTNGQLSAISYDEANRKFDSMNKIDLAATFLPPAQPQQPRR